MNKLTKSTALLFCQVHLLPAAFVTRQKEETTVASTPLPLRQTSLRRDNTDRTSNNETAQTTV